MKQKKLLTLLLCLAMIFCLAACSSDDETTDDTGDDTTVTDDTSDTTDDATTDDTADDTTDTTVTDDTSGSEDTSSDTGTSSEFITLSSVFNDENGAALDSASVSLTVDGEQTDYTCGTDGSLSVSDLPSDGIIALDISDSSGTLLGSVELEFAQGSVTDAAYTAENSYYVTVSGDAVSLIFAIDSEGVVTCELDV